MKQSAGLGGLGRFAEPAVLVMVSLAQGAKHGYAITSDIEVVSGFRLGPGTLYGAIARLEERGLIEPVPSDDRRRPYRLTARGAEALRGHLEMLKRVTTAGSRRLAKT
ncbi:MAG TPA: helix-turn-helix transcriptional regulator [Candidatus Dormibacteraeota bacterium]